MRGRNLLVCLAMAVGMVVADALPARNPGVAAAGDPHAYFNALVGRKDFWKGFSLRPVSGIACNSGSYSSGVAGEGTCHPYFENQLAAKLPLGYRNGSSLGAPEASFIAYDPVSDSDANRQDAAKLRIPAFATADTLRTQIDASTTTIELNSPATIGMFSTGRGIRIDNEILVCHSVPDFDLTRNGAHCSKNENGVLKIQVLRGQFGTKAVSHNAAAAVGRSVNGLEPAAQIRFPLNTVDGSSYLFTYDVYFTDSWLGLEADTAAKMFQLSAAGTNGGVDGIWYETKFMYQGGDSSTGRCAGWDKSRHIGAVRVRSYNNTFTGATTWALTDSRRLGPNTTDNDPALLPMRGSFCVLPNQWTRIWIEIQQVANDYDLVSMWVADEERDAVQLYDRLQISVPSEGPAGNRIHKWWIEGNNSFVQHSRGSVNPFRDYVMYIRNFAALVNPVDVPRLLERPASGPAPSAPKGLRVVRP